MAVSVLESANINNHLSIVSQYCDSLNIPYLQRVYGVPAWGEDVVRLVFVFDFPWRTGETEIPHLVSKTDFYDEDSMVKILREAVQMVRYQAISMVSNFYTTISAAKPLLKNVNQDTSEKA